MYRIQQRDLVEQPTLVTRARLTVPDIRGWIGPALGRVMAAIDAAGDAPAGPPFARFEPAEDRLDTFDVEAGFPVAVPVSTAPEGVLPSSLPAGPAVVTTYIGPYDAMTPAYDALEKSVAECGGAVVGPPWERYLTRPVGDPAGWATEIVLPYRIG